MMDKEEFMDRIEVDTDTCGGRPHVKNTRIDISVILDALSEGLSAEKVVDHYPALEIDDVRACVAYAAELSRENTWKLTAS